MSVRYLVAMCLVVAACATTGAPGEGDRNLPSAGVGPFRALTTSEIKGLAPFVLEDKEAQYRDPAVIRGADGVSTLLFAVARASGVDVIVRTRALDERTFFGNSTHFGNKPLSVLQPDRLWEEGALSGPSVVRYGGDLLLYYAGREGIGVARSANDGLSFRKEPGPILSRDILPETWETAPPSAPSVFVLPDNKTLRMLYVAGTAIGEAESADGIEWRRLRPGPLLAPTQPPAFDSAAVGDPCVVTRVTAAGRVHVRVLYTGWDASGASAIGFAARYGADGVLDRRADPVYGKSAHEASPALLDLGVSSFLYVAQDRRDGSAVFPAIAGAYAPVDVTLPPASDFPEGP